MRRPESIGTGAEAGRMAIRPSRNPLFQFDSVPNSEVGLVPNSLRKLATKFGSEPGCLDMVAKNPTMSSSQTGLLRLLVLI